MMDKKLFKFVLLSLFLLLGINVMPVSADFNTEANKEIVKEENWKTPILEQIQLYIGIKIENGVIEDQNIEIGKIIKLKNKAD